MLKKKMRAILYYLLYYLQVNLLVNWEDFIYVHLLQQIKPSQVVISDTETLMDFISDSIWQQSSLTQSLLHHQLKRKRKIYY